MTTLLVLTGCGYSAGYPDLGVQTIALEIASNDTFWQRREIGLSRALAVQIPRHTALTITHHAHADTILRVRIESIDPRTLVVGQAPVLEGALQYQVRMQLVDRLTAAIRVERLVLDQAEYRIPVGEGLASAQLEADDDLARKIALALSDLK